MDDGVARRASALTRDDWVGAALEELLAHGVDSLRIDTLARALGVTKGSFYHHFSNRDDLVEAVATYWEVTQPERVLARIGTERSAPLERLRHLARLFSDLQIGPQDRAVRAAASSEPRLASAVERADARIRDALEAMLREAGVPETDASAFTRLMMLAAIGHHAAPHLSGKQGARELGKRLLSLIEASRHE